MTKITKAEKGNVPLRIGTACLEAVGGQTNSLAARTKVDLPIDPPTLSLWLRFSALIS